MREKMSRGGHMLRGPAEAGHLSMRGLGCFPHPEVLAKRASKGHAAGRAKWVLVLVALSLTLTACGIKGDPEAPRAEPMEQAR